MKRKKLKIFFLCSLLSFVVMLSAIAAQITIYGRKDEKCQCDVAIVLGAGTTDGTVSAVYRERINHGIWLLENGYVDALILTGGVGEGNIVSDAYAAKEYAVANGISGDVIFIEEVSTITEENLQQAKAIMDENGLETAIIVSDPLHMKRAMLMARNYGITAWSSPTPTTMYRTLKTKLPFLAREEFFYIGYGIVGMFR